MPQQIHHIIVVLGQQTHQILGRSRTIPIVLQLHLVEGVQQAEGIIDIRHLLAEVIAVVAFLQASL